MSRYSSLSPFGPGGTPRVVIVGAGFGGIGLGVLLKKAGIHTFTIYDRSERVGGTWWHNRYPGAEVDTLSYVYSYVFKPYAWSRSHARQAELHAYLEETVDEFGVRPHVRLGVGVRSAAWDESSHTYRLTLDGGETAECDVLVAATGFLNIPHYPSWPGLDDFQGPKFHTARWEHQHDLTGKTVAVVGTGSTATQVVPELAKTVGKLYLFQREPGWVIPKGEREYSRAESARLRNPLRYRIARLKWFWMAERRTWRGAPYRPGTPANDKGHAAAVAFIEREFADRPDLRKAVTPDYPFWGKRLVFNSTFYRSLKNDNVELVPRAVAALTHDAVVDADGVERTIDALVMATGFQPTNYVGTMEVRGGDGRTLQEHWQGEPRAFLGITVPDFPNFFILYGPGTNGGEIVSMIMWQARHVVRVLRRMRRRRLTAIEVKRFWADVYDVWLQSQVNATCWVESNNYYRGPTGKIVTQWPFGQGVYGLLTRVLGARSERGRRRGES